jgi:hypothetical protein
MPLSHQIFVRDALPAFRARTVASTHPVWDLPLDWSDDDLLGQLVQLIDDYLHRVRDSVDELQALARAILSDLRALQGGLRDDALVQCHFLQIHLGVCLMDFGRQTGMLQVTYDWIIHSISDNDAEDQDVLFEYPRLDAMIRSRHPLITCNALRVFLTWLEVLCYYSRLQGAHRFSAEQFKSGCLRVFEGMVEKMENPSPNGLHRAYESDLFDYAVPAVCQMISWAGTNHVPLDYDPLPLLGRSYANPLVSRKTRKLIGLFLTTQFGSRLTCERVAWARRTLVEHAAELIGHERLQLLITCVGSVEQAEADRGPLLGEIRRVARESLVVAGDDVPLFCYGQSRLFEFLVPLVRLLADHGQCDYLLEVISAWYGVPAAERRTGPYLLCMGSHEHGVLYATEGRTLLLRQNQDASMPRLAESGNRFFGTNMTLTDFPDLVPHITDRRGVPVSEEGARYEEVVREHYRIAELASAFESIGAGVEGLIEIHGTRDPLQPLIASATGRVLPLITSFRPPSPDRPLRRILFWSGGTFLGGFGINAAVKYLSRAGVVCDVVPDVKLSAEEFRRVYELPDYDIIWINAHAEYDHYDPHKVFLKLFPGADQGASLSQLVKLPVPGEARRLLFLNACDGGTATPMSGPTKLGLAPMLSSPRQAVVSHLWPVEQIYASLLDGLLAIGLVREPGYLPAFSFATESLRAGRDAALALLRQEMGDDCELLARLEARSLELDNIAAWGPPSFFE